MVSQNSGSADELLAAYRTFQEYRVNGMIFWDPELPAGTPVPARFHELNDVLFIGRPPVDGPRFIDIDWSTGTQEAAEHFLAIRPPPPVLKLPIVPLITRRGANRRLSPRDAAGRTSRKRGFFSDSHRLFAGAGHLRKALEQVN